MRSDIVCCVPQITVPGDVNFGEVCASGVQTKDLDVCNTGIEDLEIDSIDSSDTAFAVTTPSSGWPIVISKDFCFPLEVTYNPAEGDAAGVLTLNNNDPVNPALQVAVTADAGTASINTFIVDNGSFGEVCSGDLHDLNLTIQSKGKRTPSPVHLQFTDVDSQMADVCGNTVIWHVNQETLPSVGTTGSNPKSSYQVSTREGNLATSQSFSLDQCEFREFQLELLDSSSPSCTLLPKGASCDNAGQCCSGKCTGPNGGKTCK